MDPRARKRMAHQSVCAAAKKHHEDAALFR